MPTLPRLFLDADLAAGATLPLDEDASRYLGTVLRRGAGDEILVFNGRQGEWRGALEAPAKKKLALRLLEETRPQPFAPTPLILAFTPLKAAPLEWLVEKATELGATHLAPVVTERTQPRPWPEARLKKIIVEAAEQCERLMLPSLGAPQPLEAFVKALDAPLYLAVEDDRAGLARQPLARLAKPGPAALMIGPEGGLTDADIARAASAKTFHAFSLGPLVLRAETAGLAALAAWQSANI